MPEAYSTDLRERARVVVETGEAPEAMAEQSMVGRARRRGGPDGLHLTS
jgi:hypothetical protein